MKYMSDSRYTLNDEQRLDLFTRASFLHERVSRGGVNPGARYGERFKKIEDHLKGVRIPLVKKYMNGLRRQASGLPKVEQGKNPVWYDYLLDILAIEPADWPESPLPFGDIFTPMVQRFDAEIQESLHRRKIEAPQDF